MRLCVHVLVCVAAAVAVVSCKKKSSEATPPPAPAADARLADRVPKVDDAAALAPASIVLPATVAHLAADGTVTGAPPPPAPKPPEPPPADADDGSEESGGTGTNVNLEEKSAAQLAREKAIEIAKHPHDPSFKVEGLLAEPIPKGERYDSSSSPLRPSPGVPAEAPQRQGKALAESLDEPLPAAMPELLVAAHPTAKASALVELVAVHPALLAVAHQGSVRALRVAFVARGETRWNGNWTPWVEVRVTAGGVVVESVPGAPVTLGEPLDGKALGAAWNAAREPLTLPDRVDVDVLVDEGVTVQRLVDVLAALDAGGARVFALGTLPAAESDELAKRGKPLRFVQYLRISLVGELDRAVVEEVLAAARPAFTACWEKTLARDPTAAGTVHAPFFIMPNGTVAASNGRGIDTETSACVAKVIRGLEFPKPGGGSGVQVNAPFAFRR
jgi:hypothetical protein